MRHGFYSFNILKESSCLLKKCPPTPGQLPRPTRSIFNKWKETNTESRATFRTTRLLLDPMGSFSAQLGHPVLLGRQDDLRGSPHVPFPRSSVWTHWGQRQSDRENAPKSVASVLKWVSSLNRGSRTFKSKQPQSKVCPPPLTRPCRGSSPIL